MSLHSTSRTSSFRRGLVALAAGATLLAGGLVAAPAAQAALPLVDTSKRDGTVVTTRMSTDTTDISVVGNTLEPVFLWYDVKLGWTGGTLNLHRIDLDDVKKHSIRRETRIRAEITNPEATDGRPSRITGSVRALGLSRDGDISWSTLRGGTVRLAYDPDGSLPGTEPSVHVRDLTIRPNGKFSTVVPAREGAWEIRYGGNHWLDRSFTSVPDRGGCGC